MISVAYCIKINKVTSLGFRSLSEFSISCLEVLCIIFWRYHAYRLRSYRFTTLLAIVPRVIILKECFELAVFMS